MSRMRVLITGANGFVGAATVSRALNEANLAVSASVRGAAPTALRGLTVFAGQDLSEDADWRTALAHQDAIVHLAARVHIDEPAGARDLAEFRRVNVSGTLNLARQAAAAGARRFIFVSSIAVNGNETFGKPFTADSPVAPHSAYGVSKFEAEMGLRRVADETGLEVVIIRPPLAIGPGAPGNVARLFRVLDTGMPLPLGAVHNKRSFVAVDNLADLIVCCLEHEKAPGQVYMVSDGEDLSTTELLRRAAAALGRPARLIPVPTVLMRSVLAAAGRSDLAQRLFHSLQVDIEKTRAFLDWSPPVRIDWALRQAARYHCERLR